MSSIEEKRVYGDAAGRTVAYVASAVGVVRVGVADDRVGEFELVHRATARDVAGGGGLLAAATDSDVLVGADLDPTDFGPAVAVAVCGGGDGDAVLAAAADGEVATLARPGDGWATRGDVPDVTGADGPLLASADGVFRAADGGVRRVGDLEGVRDVAAAGPYAATREGVFRFDGGEWRREHAGDARAVAAAPDGRAHAVADGLRSRADGGWERVALPTDESPVDVAHGPATYAVTGRGTFLADAGEGWRSRALGVPGATAVAVPGSERV
ncbi:MAG: hypothetical protein ABEJ04_05390 [Halobacteriaceae archaeon]